MKFLRIANFLSVIAVFIFSTEAMVAQSSTDDSVLYERAIHNLVGLYQQSSGDQSGLFNGSQYGSYPFKFEEAGHAYFNADKSGYGSVMYDGILYENVSMQFDEIQEVLVIDSSSRRIQLLNERLAAFTLFDHNFIHIIKDSESAVLVRNGFYDILYNGNVSLLKKEEKLIREDVATGVLLRFIDVHSYYYIKRNSTYYSIKSKKSLFSIFKDRKKDVKQYVRKNKLSYRKDRENMLIRATAYYDQLIK
ncbi:MAG: hypothetical protein ABJB86_19050 [Bacteroidota bacterium]